MSDLNLWEKPLKSNSHFQMRHLRPALAKRAGRQKKLRDKLVESREIQLLIVERGGQLDTP